MPFAYWGGVHGVRLLHVNLACTETECRVLVEEVGWRYSRLVTVFRSCACFTLSPNLIPNVLLIVFVQLGLQVQVGHSISEIKEEIRVNKVRSGLST